MQKLGGCFTTWQHAEESVDKVAQLLRIDLSRVIVDGTPFNLILGAFEQSLRGIKTALENRDYVGLCDILTYETTETSNQWRSGASVDALDDRVTVFAICESSIAN